MQTIRNLGKFNIINNLTDGGGKRIAGEFIDALFRNFCSNCMKSVNAFGQAPFIYTERQLDTAILPAIASITSSFLVERPVARQWSKLRTDNWDDSHGRIDYWCKHRNVDFFIELKHSWDSYRTQNIATESHVRWEFMTKKQLSVLKSEAKELSKTTDNKGVFLLGIQIIPIYETINESKEPKSRGNFETLLNIQKNYQERFEPMPNWNGMWILHENLFENSFIQLEAKKIYYPGVLFLVNISDLIT